ncbi:MAG: lysyl endopeptidase, partial [Marinilabiliaceae bacterium]|nr:lysyl endopeptidase [Marinilabiliaceae bacterium]
MTYKRRNYKDRVRSKFWLLGLFIFIAINVSAQLESAGNPSDYSGNVEVVTLPARPKAMASESIAQTDKLPLRFAHPFFVNLTPQNSGSWEEVDGNKSIWRLGIKSNGAKSLNLIFDRFKLMEGAKLFIYNVKKTHVLGAFTSDNNKPSGLFATAPVYGDEIIVELQSKTRNKDDHQLMINAVNHDYLGIIDRIKLGRIGDSGDCNVDVICEGEKYADIKRAICRIIVDGTQYCSGTLINNAKNDGKPYFLTAAHCFHGVDIEKLGNVVLLFNYEVSECNGSTVENVNQSLSGAKMLAIADTLDFALIEMDNHPPASYQPYWAGWDRSTSINGPVYSIHHPSGDVKKISIENESPIAISSQLATVDRKPFVKDAHWLIQEWDKGT